MTRSGPIVFTTRQPETGAAVRAAGLVAAVSVAAAPGFAVAAVQATVVSSAAAVSASPRREYRSVRIGTSVESGSYPLDACSASLVEL